MTTHSTRWAATAAALVLGTVGALALLGAIAAHADGGRVVLGSKKFAPDGRGFGTVKPRSFFNGGDPSGSVGDIHWHHWGRASARAHGLNPIFKPGGGYYRKPAPIELKAFDIGRCPRSHRRAYRRLTFRVAKRPNGPIHGRWRAWSGSKTICRFSL
jgi:hypothetical protein